MKVIFRTDSSLQIGTGHVMRCLTLAKALRERGASCQFICRTLEGSILEKIIKEGFELIKMSNIPDEQIISQDHEKALEHSNWLDVSWESENEF